MNVQDDDESESGSEDEEEDDEDDNVCHSSLFLSCFLFNSLSRMS